MIMDVRERIERFIIENFLYGRQDGGLDHGLSLFDSGIVDSTGVLEIETFLREEFSMNVPDRDLVPENFQSINNLTSYVERRLRDAAGGPEVEDRPVQVA